MHATEFLKQPDKTPTGPIVVTFGEERFLRQKAAQTLVEVVLGHHEGDDFGLTRFDGRTTEIATLLDELRTISMWGDRRLVMVESAEEFVSQNRSALEHYLEKPSKKSVLLLDVKSWPKNTRLFKTVAEIGLNIDCGPLKPGDAVRWLVDTAKADFEKNLSRDAASLMVELVGSQLGLLSQELSKLAAFAGDRSQIDRDDVTVLVGGWKLQTTWEMLDALQNGDLAQAITNLDKLLTAGEAPLMILGGISFSYRKLAQATEISRQGRPLNEALAQAGVYGSKVPAAAGYLRRIGRARAERIYEWLIEADTEIKGASRLPPRLILERLMTRFSGMDSLS